MTNPLDVAPIEDIDENMVEDIVEPIVEPIDEPLLSSVAQSTEPLLRVQGLSITIDGAKVLHNASIDLAPGECIAIVGASGSGKTLFAKAMLGLTPREANVTMSERTIGGWQTATIGTDDRLWRGIRGAIVGLINQDALVSLDPLRRIGREVAESFEIHAPRASRADVLQRVRKSLVAAAMPQPDVRARQYPHELSGGLRQRALIASALSAEPRAIIADEPTTALDATVQVQVLEQLEAIKSSGIGLIVITHDLGVVAKIADRIIVMDSGRIVETGRARKVLRAPEHNATRALLDASPLPREALPVAPDAAVILSARGLTKRYHHGRSRPPALDDVTFDVREGTTIGIVGESGSGKSTLARLVLALEEPSKGEVLFDGAPWSTLNERERRPLRGAIQLIDQDPFGTLNPRWRIRRVLGEAIALSDVDSTREERHTRMLELLDLVDLPREVLARRPHALSGGQRQRVAIARALARRPRLLVCDEPVSALDASVQARVLDLLDSLRNELGLSMIFISHDLDVVAHIADEILVMQDGRVVESGAAGRVLSRPQHPFTKELKAARLKRPSLPS